MTTTENTDIRTIRTQKLIMDSFKELLNHKSFEAIRVSDISNAAEINRATFYNYYTDKYYLYGETHVRKGKSQSRFRRERKRSNRFLEEERRFS